MKRGEPLKRVAMRRTTRATGFPRAIVAQAIDRDQRCVLCDLVSDPTRLVGHHRVNRGQGGTSEPALNGVRNCLVLCWHCNGLVESNAVKATEARGRGIKLRHGDPLDTPVLYPDGVWYVLDAFGQKRPQRSAA